MTASLFKTRNRHERCSAELDSRIPGWRWFLLALVLIPIDSFPLFPVNSVYRPISVILLLPYPYLASRGAIRLPNQSRTIVSLVAFAIAWTLLSSLLIHGHYTHLSKALTTAVLAGFSTVSCLGFAHGFWACSRRTRGWFLFRWGVLMTVLVLPLSLAQLVSLFSDSLQPIAELATRALSYRYVSNRVQGVSGEPSWASRYYIVAIVLLHVGEGPRARKRLLMLANGALLLFAGSALGYISALAIPIGRVIIRSISDPRRLYRAVMAAVFTIGTVVGSYYLIVDVLPVATYAKNRIVALGEIVTNSSVDALELAARSSGSIFQRIYNPFIGMTLPFRGFPLGVGAESYHYAYRDVIPSDFPWAMRHEQVADAVRGDSIITSKFLFAKLVAEFGIVGMFAVGVLLFRILRSVRTERDSIDANRRAWLSSTALVLTANFDSYIFVPVLVLLSIVLTNGRIATRRDPTRTVRAVAT